MFYLLMMTVLIIGLYAALQIPKTQVFTTNRLTAPFEGKPEPNTLGAYLTIFFGMALSIFIYARPSGLRRLCAILAVLLPLPIMFTYSRSAYLVIIVIVIFLTIVSRRRWLIFTVVTFFILSPFILPKSVINRAIYNFTNARYHGFLDPSAAERVGVYDKAWDNIKRYTIFGRGVGADGGIIDSQYARVIIETGLFGLILFLWLLFRLLKLGIRLFRVLQEGWVKGAALGFVAVVVGAIFHCYGNVTFCIVRIAEPFWALAGLIAYSLYYINANRDNPKALELAK
jgi:O-antigen ligase